MNPDDSKRVQREARENKITNEDFAKPSEDKCARMPKIHDDADAHAKTNETETEKKTETETKKQTENQDQ